MGEVLPDKNWIACDDETFDCILVGIELISIDEQDGNIRWEVKQLDPVSRDYVKRESIEIKLTEEQKMIPPML